MTSARIQSCTSSSASSSSSIFPQPPCLSSASRHCKFPLLRSPRALSISQRVSRNCIVQRYSSGWSERQFSISKQSHIRIRHFLPAAMGSLVTSDTQAISTGPLIAEEKIGVLLLNLGGPETLEDVQPFLFNLFADPDIIRLPRLFRFLQKPLAQFISVLRAPKSKEGHSLFANLLMLSSEAEELRKSLWEKNVPAKVYVGMRYWHPFTEEAIEQIKKDGITKLVVLPLYPQFSISTSGSSLRLLESIFREDEYLVNMQHTVIPSWYQREGYIKSMANLIQKELQKFDNPEKVASFPIKMTSLTDGATHRIPTSGLYKMKNPKFAQTRTMKPKKSMWLYVYLSDNPEKSLADVVVIFFSAHGVPLAYVEEAGDPYKAEMEECVDLIIEELEKRKITNAYTLAYQSRVGPVEWLKPYTDETIVELGRKGVSSLLAVPISFVSEHIETLEEIDVEYKELAIESGIENWGRVPALGCEPMFISDLADAVIESLPYVGAMAVSNLEARQSLVPLGSVEELLAVYDSQRRELPPPVTVWEWGWTKSAETWNGRAAMLAVLVLLVLEDPLTEVNLGNEEQIDELVKVLKEEGSTDAPRAYHGLQEHNGANGDHSSDKLGDVSDIQEAVMVDLGLKGSMERMPSHKNDHCMEGSHKIGHGMGQSHKTGHNPGTTGHLTL
ncbi:Ferrochelatase [Corchorus capsularis]|uniref:Ferrochelatase n=1 Tax=Corchorus capsularis TaxID=210143 RepID=A0A1R3GBC4_COCAP|nr:Ferrochelatase [Corchorus capsularis]